MSITLSESESKTKPVNKPVTKPVATAYSNLSLMPKETNTAPMIGSLMYVDANLKRWCGYIDNDNENTLTLKACPTTYPQPNEDNIFFTSQPSGLNMPFYNIKGHNFYDVNGNGLLLSKIGVDAKIMSSNAKVETLVDRIKHNFFITASNIYTGNANYGVPLCLSVNDVTKTSPNVTKLDIKLDECKNIPEQNLFFQNMMR